MRLLMCGATVACDQLQPASVLCPAAVFVQWLSTQQLCPANTNQVAYSIQQVEVIQVAALSKRCACGLSTKQWFAQLPYRDAVWYFLVTWALVPSGGQKTCHGVLFCGVCVHSRLLESPHGPGQQCCFYRVCQQCMNKAAKGVARDVLRFVQYLCMSISRAVA
jgi:hypothetical protein